MNLAESLLGACERHPELEAFPGIPYGELLPRIRADRGRARRRARRARRVRARQPARDAAPVLGVPVGRGRRRPALVAPLRRRARVLHRGLRRGARHPGGRPAPGRSGASRGARPRRARDVAAPLHVGDDRPAEGRAAVARRRPRGRVVAGAPARLRLGRPHARRDAALPHDGNPLARSRCTSSVAASSRSRAGTPARRSAWSRRSASARCTSRRRSSTISSTTRTSAAADVSSVRALGYAGAAMTSSLVRRCVDVFRPEVFVNHYGSTEIYTFTIGRDQSRSRVAPAARPSTRGSVSTRAARSCALGSDEAFAGYWNRPDADAKAIEDGWYRTGDTGHLDEDGDLWLDGRVDDMIVSGSENIHPLEVEDVLAAHPGVVEVAVIGAVDERLGQRVVAVVVGTATRRGARRALPRLVARPLQAAARVPAYRRAAEERIGEDPATAASRRGDHVTERDGFTVEREGRSRRSPSTSPASSTGSPWPRATSSRRPSPSSTPTTPCGSSSSRGPVGNSRRAATSPVSSSAPRGRSRSSPATSPPPSDARSPSSPASREGCLVLVSELSSSRAIDLR